MGLNAILFITHQKAQCGVYEFGKSVVEVLEKSVHYHFVHLECSSLKETPFYSGVILITPW